MYNLKAPGNVLFLLLMRVLTVQRFDPQLYFEIVDINFQNYCAVY